MRYAAGEYEVVVVGAGHAGCEAALAAARMGRRTMLVTMSLDAVALMACNPAVGGPAKGHLVREIDALGGEMAVNTDRTALQVRLLNTGKGPAVQALRAQVDKKAYQARMLDVLLGQGGLTVRQGEVTGLLVEKGRVCGVVTRTGAVWRAAAVVLTGGTFLRGRVFIGELSYSSGPSGWQAARGLSRCLRELGLRLGRFKTGTPPRVRASSVDFSRTQEQPGDPGGLYFSFLEEAAERPNLSCWLTYTNEETHRLIRENLHRSPLYGGAIRGVGPRYCPSIEDKVVRFPERPAHQVFLEPEGRDGREIYVQGMSTSLPEDVQLAVLHSIPGLEKAEMLRPGYAIEYDYLLPEQLDLGLQVRDIRGLFTAGQVNGTSGYEEAAGQGILAGINAALVARGEEPLTIRRSQGYLGVMVDDLVTRGTGEPYRLLTSRAEYRLLLRQGNADRRLTALGRQVGLVDDRRWDAFCRRWDGIARERRRLEGLRLSARDEGLAGFLRRVGSPLPEGSVTAAELLRRPEVSYRNLAEALGWPAVPENVWTEVEIELKYEGYIRQQERQVARFERLEERLLPPHWDYKSLRGLSREAADSLSARRPRSLGQASRVPGVTPADINCLLVHLEKRRREEGSRE